MSGQPLGQPGPPAEAAAERQIVALHLAEEIYGVDIAHVDTVIMPPAITPVPKTPAFVAGVINLRGRILPVIDLRRRLGLPPRPGETQRGARIVIVDVAGLTAGLVVDAVSEVMRLPADSIAPPAPLVASPETECIVGIGRIPVQKRAAAGGDRSVDPAGRDGERAERLVILLDTYKTLTASPAGSAALERLEAA